jgi:hypothetical protein
MDSKYHQKVVISVWNKEARAHDLQTVDLYFTIDWPKLGEMLACKVVSNKTGKTRTLNGIIAAKGKIISQKRQG